MNAEMALWATTNKTRQKYHCTRKHTTGLHEHFFLSLRQCDCYLSLQCIELNTAKEAS